MATMIGTVGVKLNSQSMSVLCGHFLSSSGHDFHIVYYLLNLLQCVDGLVKDIKTMI